MPMGHLHICSWRTSIYCNPAELGYKIVLLHAQGLDADYIAANIVTTNTEHTEGVIIY